MISALPLALERFNTLSQDGFQLLLHRQIDGQHHILAVFGRHDAYYPDWQPTAHPGVGNGFELPRNALQLLIHRLLDPILTLPLIVDKAQHLRQQAALGIGPIILGNRAYPCQLEGRDFLAAP